MQNVPCRIASGLPMQSMWTGPPPCDRHRPRAGRDVPQRDCAGCAGSRRKSALALQRSSGLKSASRGSCPTLQPYAVRQGCAAGLARGRLRQMGHGEGDAHRKDTESQAQAVPFFPLASGCGPQDRRGASACSDLTPKSQGADAPSRRWCPPSHHVRYGAQRRRDAPRMRSLQRRHGLAQHFGLLTDLRKLGLERASLGFTLRVSSALGCGTSLLGLGRFSGFYRRLNTAPRANRCGPIRRRTQRDDKFERVRLGIKKTRHIRRAAGRAQPRRP